jgi:hypothetical protein
MKAKVRLLAILLLSVSPTTALGFKCGRSIINEGKSIEYVLDRCGQPSYSQEHTEYRVFRQTPPAPDIVEPIIIQEWRYNFGRNRLMRYLRFENGILKETESIGIQRSNTLLCIDPILLSLPIKRDILSPLLLEDETRKLPGRRCSLRQSAPLVRESRDLPAPDRRRSPRRRS